MRRKLLVLPALAVGLIGLSHAQPPGGDGGRMRFGGGSPDPEMIWGFIAKGQPSINLNAPEHARTKDRMVKEGTPIPADGVLTKEAFKANFQARMQQRMSGGGTPSGPQMQFNPAGGPPGGDRGGRGGYDPSTMTDDQVRQFMSRYDRDGDGRISAAEADQGGSSSMKERFAQYDANRDGFMDLNEYRAYNVGRFQERMQQSSPGTPPPAVPQYTPPVAPGGPPPAQPAPGQQPSAEEARPEVMRYGKLPKGAPSFFLAPSASNKDGLDADRDGQIGLYEWRRAGRKTAEFVEKDLNGDGYLTFTEFKAWNERVAEQQRQDDPDAPAPVVITPGGSADRGDRSRGDRDRKGPPPGRDGKDDRREKGERKGPTRNPFANSNKG